MRRISITLAAFTLLTTSVPVRAQDTPAKWAARLGSSNYTEREKAARALEELGKAALPALLDLAKSSDLETKRRAILIGERIEDRVTLQELTKATPVHLRFQNLPMAEALREVEKQTGLRTGIPKSKNRISLDTGIVPYWQAWGQFCAAARLAESDYARSAAKLKRMNERDLEELVSQLGRNGMNQSPYWSPPLEFAATPSPHRDSVDDRHSIRVKVRWHALDKWLDEKTPHAIFAVEVRSEPRLEIVASPRVEITKLVDEQGRTRNLWPLKLFPDFARPEVQAFVSAYVGETQYGGLLQLKAFAWPGPACSLKEVHGKVRLDVAIRPRMIEVLSVLKSVGKEERGFQGITLKILEAQTTEEGDIHLRVRLDNIESLTPQSTDQQVVRIRPGVVALRGAMDVAMDRLELVDPTGRKCLRQKARYEKAEDGKGYETELLFSPSGTKNDELTLVMTKAPRTVPLEIPFLVRDVVWTEKKE